jgi:hypothetical protein
MQCLLSLRIGIKRRLGVIVPGRFFKNRTVRIYYYLEKMLDFSALLAIRNMSLLIVNLELQSFPLA